jgi:hypothetical protein
MPYASVSGRPIRPQVSGAVEVTLGSVRAEEAQRGGYPVGESK